jgi:hypothetical protein
MTCSNGICCGQEPPCLWVQKGGCFSHDVGRDVHVYPLVLDLVRGFCWLAVRSAMNLVAWVSVSCCWGFELLEAMVLCCSECSSMFLCVFKSSLETVCVLKYCLVVNG